MKTKEIKTITPKRRKNTVRMKESKKTFKTSLSINRGIQGDSIEIMLERLREGEGEDAISDRDLVYNDNETEKVNPITNIRSDKMELLLEEKMGEYEHKHRQQKPTEEKPTEKEKTEGGGEEE